MRPQCLQGYLDPSVMTKPPSSSPPATTTETLSDLVAMHEGTVKEARRTEQPGQIVASAKRAAGAIRARVPAASADLSEEERAALTAVKGLLYNAAADAWPGWSVDGNGASPEELASALELARESADLVEALSLGKCQEGTAAWLVGALELALGRIEDSLTTFSRAERLFGEAGEPSLTLLARGYSAIAREAGDAAAGDLSELSAILEELSAGKFRDGEAFCEQLRTAHQVFARR